MDEEEVPDFASPAEELSFWRTRARELKVELDEFTEDSNQLEKELEITIKLKDDQLSDVRHKYQRQQHDIDSLQAKLKQSENECLQWEQRYKKEKAEAEVLRKHTRELEQKNDDLERAHRIVSESVTEFERMLNREYEKNVMLEVEYEMEKENSQIQLQRLMDEARDLKQELKIQQKQPGTVRTTASVDGQPESKNLKLDQEQAMDVGAKDDDGDNADNKNNIDADDDDDDKNKKHSNDSEVEKAELERSSSERRGSLKLEAELKVNGSSSTTTTKEGHDSVADSGQSLKKVSMRRTTVTTSGATMQRENSLKQMDRMKNGGSMTASSRSAALAIVADLLRRVNDCLQLDTKLVCVQCKTLTCECPSATVERRSISGLQENPMIRSGSQSDSVPRPFPLNSEVKEAEERNGVEQSRSESRAFAWPSSQTSASELDDRPAAIRLASILGLKRATSTANVQSTGTGPLPRNAIHATTTATNVPNGSGLDNMAMRRTGSRDNLLSSPAANWFRDKYQMATNKLMSSKNIDATLKELKRPKSMDEDLADVDEGQTTTTTAGGGSEKAKSPSLIC